MTQDEVRDLIDKYIIKNSMGAITAVIMRPILEEILNQPNALIGNLEYLDTLEKTTIVDAINSIVNGQIIEINAKILELIEKDVEQDQRLDLVEQHDRDQDGRLDSIENHDASQDVRLDGIELKNEEQDTRLTDIEGVNFAQDNEIQSLKNKDISQDAEIQNLKDKDILQDAEITDLDNRVDTLENKVTTVYIPKGSVADITALFALTNQGIGWVYNLEDTGMNYVWLGGNEGDQGNGWDSLGGWVDFSEYYTRLEVDAKLDAMDLQKITDIGNTTTNDINIISQNGERLAVLDSDDIILSDLTTGKNTTISNAGGNTILEYSDNGITNGLSINKDRTVFTKLVQGVDAEDNLDFTTLQQVIDLIAQGGGDVEVGFGLSKNEDGSVRLGKEIDLGYDTIINNIEIGDDYFMIGKIDLENDKFGNISIFPGGSTTIASDLSIYIKSGGNTDITSDSNIAIKSSGSTDIASDSNIAIKSSGNTDITSKNNLLLGNLDANNRTVLSETFGVNEYLFSGPDEDLIKYLIGNEFIDFYIRIRGKDAIQPGELTTKRQLDSKNYIISPDGSKWGIDNEGNNYKII